MSQRPTKIKSELEERVHCCGINQVFSISSSLLPICRLLDHQISRGDGKGRMSVIWERLSALHASHPSLPEHRRSSRSAQTSHRPSGKA